MRIRSRGHFAGGQPGEARGQLKMSHIGHAIRGLIKSPHGGETAAGKTRRTLGYPRQADRWGKRRLERLKKMQLAESRPVAWPDPLPGGVRKPKGQGRGFAPGFFSRPGGGSKRGVCTWARSARQRRHGCAAWGSGVAGRRAGSEARACGARVGTGQQGCDPPERKTRHRMPLQTKTNK